MSWVFCVCTYLIMNGRAVLWAKKISNGNLLWRLLSFLALFCLWYRIPSSPYIFLVQYISTQDLIQSNSLKNVVNWNGLLFWCFMQLWCCCLALKPFPMIFRIHKVGGNIFRVPLDTGGDPEGVDLLSALAAGWPPYANKKRVIFVSNASWSKDLDAKGMDELP